MKPCPVCLGTKEAAPGLDCAHCNAWGVVPFYDTGAVMVWQADVLAWAIWYKAEIDAGRAEPFHAIVTDPPYALGATPPIEKLLAAWLAYETFDFSPGFMGKDWDVLPGPQIWCALLDIVYPGGYLFAFSGTRTADLLGISCRIGGWEPFDRVTNFQWVYSSGFPKSHNISKALDANAVVSCPNCYGHGIIMPIMLERSVRAWARNQGVSYQEAVLVLSDQCETCSGTGQVTGVEREVVGPNIRRGDKKPYVTNVSPDAILGGGFVKHQTKGIVTAPATPLAKAFDGYGTALKPSGEPVLLFRKPREGRTFAQCAREFGSGALDIDQCRVGIQDGDKDFRRSPGNSNTPFALPPGMYEPTGKKNITDNPHSESVRHNAAGRWPPNTHFSHVPPTETCPTCHGAGCDECHGVGMVEGCVRVGSKRVKCSLSPSDTGSNTTKNAYGEYSNRSMVHYSDPDGRETVAAWRCVEGCSVRALDEQGVQAGVHGAGNQVYKPLPTKDTTVRFNSSAVNTGVRSFGDKGSCSRFYPCHDWSYEIAERLAGETPCPICLTRIPKHSTMSEMQPGDKSCENANGVRKNSSPRDGNSDSAQINVPLSGHQESAGKSDGLITLADTAAQNSATMPVTKGPTAPPNAAPLQQNKLVQIVKSAGNLCDLCAIAFVRSLVLMLQEKNQALPLGLDSIPEHNECTPIYNLVANAEIQKPLDITQIIQSPTLLSGFVIHVMASFTEEKESDRNPSWSREIANRLAQETPFRYCAKSSRGERDAGLGEFSEHGCAHRYGSIRQNRGSGYDEGSQARNTGPCVKPLSLAQWLTTLCRPPAQFKPRLCVPFAGTGSEAIGAILAGGWAEIHAIEREQEYVEIAAARIAWWSKWAKLTGKSDPAEIRKLGEAAESKEAWQNDERQRSMFEFTEGLE